VFKKAADELYRVDRQWRGVLDAQTSIIEEILALVVPSNKDISRIKDAKTPLDVALGDFKFTLQKAI
jgi:hypothetical protein